jgi:hypothetical protein
MQSSVRVQAEYECSLCNRMSLIQNYFVTYVVYSNGNLCFVKTNKCTENLVSICGPHMYLLLVVRLVMLLTGGNTCPVC